ncbi:MAG: LytTR family DNA-binding domain-containing protein [Chitinophagaceae bacterium]
MNLTCIVVDDEPLARKVITEYIADTDFIELIGEAENSLKAMNLIATKKVDLIFLDIQMPKISGIEFLKINKNLPMVVFTTAFPEYAIEGYELDVIDYLIKPITYERFLKAAVKARDFFTIKSQAQSNKISNDANYFFIKCDNKLEKILFDDIFFIEGMSNYITLHTKIRKFITYLTMRSLIERLPEKLFIQIHKSYVVSISKIDRLDINEVWINDKALPISKSFKDQLMQSINGMIIKR